MTEQRTRRQRLEADRDRLEVAIHGEVQVKDLPALIREHRAVLAELDALPDTSEVSSADEIAARREARRAGSANPARSKRQG